MKTEDKLALIKDVLDEMKAEDVVVIDASNRTIMADAFVVVTASSNTHARAMADRMHLALKEAGMREDHSEMDAGREWTIMDLGDVVVHIFQEKARRFYNLEELWGKVSAARVKRNEMDRAEANSPEPAPEPRETDADKKPKKKMPPGMERLAEEAKAARGKKSAGKSAGPTYRSGAKLVRKAPAKRSAR